MKCGIMIKAPLTLLLIVLCVAHLPSRNAAPPPEAFLVLKRSLAAGPRITPYLKYQTEMAWREDSVRRKAFEGLRNEAGLLHLQSELRDKLLKMLGGLPDKRTPLNAHVTGKIQMDGFHIEKLIFESLPGFYVSALIYVPDNRRGPHPGVLVPCGHSSNGKVHYQALCQRLVQRGYLVICWDPVGQAERSQFWDASAGKSRYNLICAEHAILGNLAYLAGTNLARWEIWDGIRAVDYLLSRPDIDPKRINITGTSGGGFQAAHIAALDERVKVAAPSCYITALPMRVYNRIFKDPDSDPEQDLYGMISSGVDHSGLLLLLYPRPVFIAAAVLDFFPIEGTHKTFQEVAEIYARFGHADRIAMVEGYHEHQFSSENQEAALDLVDRFNGLPATHPQPQIRELDEKTLQCTRTGQVLLYDPHGRSLMDLIREYYLEHKNRSTKTIAQRYQDDLYPGINRWHITPDVAPAENKIGSEAIGNTRFEEISIDKYLLHHSGYLSLPLLHIHHSGHPAQRALLWFTLNGKATVADWPEILKYVREGFDVVSFDFRGLGETRMPYEATSIDDPALAQLDFDHSYVSPISGVLADYVYNSLLIGRPYFLQMIEDAEIASRFARSKLDAKEVSVTADAEGYLLAKSIAAVIPGISVEEPPGKATLKWSEIVDQKRELWPIQYLLPNGAYIR